MDKGGNRKASDGLKHEDKKVWDTLKRTHVFDKDAKKAAELVASNRTMSALRKAVRSATLDPKPVVMKAEPVVKEEPESEQEEEQQQAPASSGPTDRELELELELSQMQSKFQALQQQYRQQQQQQRQQQPKDSPPILEIAEDSDSDTTPREPTTQQEKPKVLVKCDLGVGVGRFGHHEVAGAVFWKKLVSESPWCAFCSAAPRQGPAMHAHFKDYNVDFIANIEGCVRKTLHLAHDMSFFGSPCFWAPCPDCGQYATRCKCDPEEKGLMNRKPEALLRANEAKFREFYRRYHQALWDFKIVRGSRMITREAEDAFHWRSIGSFLGPLDPCGPYPLAPSFSTSEWRAMVALAPYGRCIREHMLAIDWENEDDASLPDAPEDMDEDMDED